jgi:hypothetical protein
MNECTGMVVLPLGCRLLLVDGEEDSNGTHNKQTNHQGVGGGGRNAFRWSIDLPIKFFRTVIAPGHIKKCVSRVACRRSHLNPDYGEHGFIYLWGNCFLQIHQCFSHFMYVVRYRPLLSSWCVRSTFNVRLGSHFLALSAVNRQLSTAPTVNSANRQPPQREQRTTNLTPTRYVPSVFGKNLSSLSTLKPQASSVRACCLLHVG